jgi:TP901 family phage tail tape measure protein
MASPDVILSIGGDLSPLLRQLRGLDKNNKFNFAINDRASTLALGRIRAGADQVTSSIEAANQRVIAFGASAIVIGSTIRAFNELAKSTVQVEKTFAEINSVFTLSAKSLNQFSKELFNVARQTGQSFEVAGKAALEFSRQGLTVEQTLIRTADALTLTRQSGLDAAKSVEALTAAVNGFSRESLTTTQIVNKLVAVDTRFAVSSADLAEALSRVGSTAQDAGLGLDQLIGLVTSAQQITARGGAVIGNAFKTIFTRLGRTDTLDQLENLGVVVRDLQGNSLSADRVLQNLAKTFDTLTEAQKQQVSELSAGIFQINQFRSILADLGRSYNVFTQATAASAVASNEAAKRNEALNKTLSTLLQNTKTTATEIGAIIGNLTFAEPLRKALTALNDNSIVDYLKGLSNSPETASVGENIGQGILKGIGNILTGPALPFLLVTLGKVIGKTFTVLKQDIGGLIGSRNEELATIQSIERTLGAANQADQRRFLTAKSVKEQEEIILKILKEQNAIRAAQVGRTNTILQGLSTSTKRQLNAKNAAGGLLPSIAAEQNSVRKGVGGASSSAKAVVIPNFNYGKGKRGTVVANTDEYLVPNYANSGGSAIFNKEMIAAMGIPKGAKKIAANGLIPNFANISRADLSKLLKSTKIQSITYQKKSGEIADYNAAQWSVRRDLLVGAPPPAGVKSWSQFDEQTNSLVLRSLKAGDKEPSFRRFLMDGIKQVRANGQVYDVAAGGYVPNLANEYLREKGVAKLLGQGAYGTAFDLDNKDIVTKKFKGKIGAFSEFVARKILANQKQTNSGVEILPPIGNINRSVDRRYFGSKKTNLIPSGIGEFYDDEFQQSISQLLTTQATEDVRRKIKNSDIDSFLVEDVHAQNYGVNERFKNILDKISYRKKLSSRKNQIGSTLRNITKDTQRRNIFFERISKAGGKIEVFDPGFKRSSYDAENLNSIIYKNKSLFPDYKNIFSSGYVPKDFQFTTDDLALSAPRQSMDFERFLVQVDPSYLNSFLDIEKQDPSLAKFIRNVVDSHSPVEQKQMSQYLGGQYVQYTPQKYGLGTTSYLNLEAGPKAIRAQIAEVFERFKMKVPNFAVMTKLYRGIARPSSEISKTEASKSRFPYDADNISEEKRITDFDSLITYLGRSRLSTRPGTIPFSRNFKTAAEFANAGYAKESDLVENKEEYFSANKYGMGSRIATQAIIESNIKESRIYKDSKVLQKLIKKIGFDKFFSVFKEGKVGIDTRLIKQALSEKSGPRTSSDLATLQALSDYGYEEEVSFFNNIPSNSKFFNIGKGKPYRNNPDQIANGYIPSFNNPIAAAIAREKEASGLPLSQIYLDKNDKVKSLNNPMGLLVANRRDEPVSGSQGVNRVLKQGGDPRKAGMAKGYVPNFAEFDESRFIAGSEQTDFNQFFISKGDAGKLRSMFRALRQEGTKSVDEFIRLKGEIENFAKSAKLTKESFNEINSKIQSAGNKLASNLVQSAKQRVADEKLEKDTVAQNAIRARDFEKAKAQLPQANIPSDTSSQDRAQAQRNRRAQINTAFSQKDSLERQNSDELARLQSEEENSANARIRARDIQVARIEKQRKEQFKASYKEALELQKQAQEAEKKALRASDALYAARGRTTSESRKASPETQSNTAAILAASSKGGLITNLASNPNGTITQGNPLGTPSFRELSLKKQLTGLSNDQLSDLFQRSRGNQNPQGLFAFQSKADRTSNILKTRNTLSDPSAFKSGGKLVADTNVSNAVLGLAKSGTLGTNFEQSVKKLIISGQTLEKAYIKASQDVLDTGGNSKQLGRIQTDYAQSLVAFERETKEATKQLAREKLVKKRGEQGIQAAFGRQATFNQAQDALQNGSSFTQLNKSQQKIIQNTLLQEARKELGFGGITTTQQRANPEINKQINERFAQKLNELSISGKDNTKLFDQLKSFTGIFKNPEKIAEQIIKKANIGTDSRQANNLRNQAAALGQQRSNRLSNAGLALSFLTPAIAGFVPEAEGGTATGKKLGAASGGLQGLGTGASIGSFFGAKGTGIGAIVGVISGAIAGFVSKSTKSFEELAASINEVNAANSQQVNAISTYVQLQQQITDAVQSGASDRQVNGLLQQQSAVLGRVSSSSDRNALIDAGSDINKLIEVLQRINIRSDTEGRRGDALGSLFKTKDSGFKPKEIESTAQALAVATDVTSEAVKKSLEKFREAIKNDPIKAFETFGKDLGFSANQIKDVSQKLGGSPEQLGVIFKRYLEVTDQFSKDLSKQEDANRRRLISRDFSKLLRSASQEISFGSEINVANVGSQNRIAGSKASALNRILNTNASSNIQIASSRESALLNVQDLNSNDKIKRETQIAINSALNSQAQASGNNNRETQLSINEALRENALLKQTTLQRSKASILNLAGTNEEVKGSIPNTLLAQLSNLNSQKDFENLASQLGNSNLILKEELNKVVQELTLINVNSKNTVEELTNNGRLQNEEIINNGRLQIQELINNGRLQEIQNKSAQKNTLLGNATFDQGNRESLFQSRLKAQTISFGRGGSANQLSGLLDQLKLTEGLGLPDTNDSINLKNAINEKSVITTLSETLSEILGKNIQASRDAVKEGIKEFNAKPANNSGQGILDNVIVGKLSASLDLLDFDPQKAIEDLSQGINLDKLVQSNKINFGDAGLSKAIVNLNTPLDQISAKLGESGPLATILKDIENNRRAALEQGKQDKLNLENKDITKKIGNLETQIQERGLKSISRDDLTKSIPVKRGFDTVEISDLNAIRKNDNNRRLVEFLSKNFSQDSTALDILNKLGTLDASKPIENVNLTRAQIEDIIKKVPTKLSPVEEKNTGKALTEIVNLKKALIDNTNAIEASKNKEKSILGSKLSPFIERPKQKIESSILNEVLNGKGQFLTGFAPKASPTNFSPQDLLRAGSNATVISGTPNITSDLSSQRTSNKYKDFADNNGGLTPDQADIVTLTRAVQLANEQNENAKTLNLTYTDRLNLLKAINNAQLDLAIAERNEFDSFTAGFKSRILEMQNEVSNFGQFGADIASSLENNLGNAFGDFAIGAKTGKDAFRDFAISVLSDASRAFASKAVQGLLGSVFGSFGLGANQGGPISRNSGGAIPFANGGTVPAMLTGGEYYFGPRESQMLGKDFLTKMNAGTLETRKYARGGLVQGGSGVKDDVPARLQPGGFVVKRSSVQKYGADYLNALSAGRVQGRFIGGAILGALLGGGVGYATGGKKGAVIGAIGGGIAGGFAQNAGLLKGIGLNSTKAVTPGFGQASGLSLSGAKGGLSSVGLDAPEKLGFAARLQNLSDFQKMGLGLGASALLGLGARALTPKDSIEQGRVMTDEEITANRIKLEGEQSSEFSSARERGQFAYLQLNPQGGYSLGQFGGAPATRRFALGGSVDFAKMAQMGSFSRNNGGYIGASMPEIPNFTAGYSTADTKEYNAGGSVSPIIPASPSPVFRADGGYVGAPMASNPLQNEKVSSNSIDIKVEINNNGTTSAQSNTEGDENGLGNKGFGEGLAQTIKAYVDERLVEQSRNGGILKQRERSAR